MSNQDDQNADGWERDRQRKTDHQNAGLIGMLLFNKWFWLIAIGLMAFNMLFQFLKGLG